MQQPAVPSDPSSSSSWSQIQEDSRTHIVSSHAEPEGPSRGAPAPAAPAEDWQHSSPRQAAAARQPAPAAAQPAGQSRPAQPAPQADQRSRQGHHEPEKVLDEPEPAEGSAFGWGVLAFFILPVGLILWLVWRQTKPAASRGSRNGFIVSLVLILLAIVGFVALPLLGVSMPFGSPPAPTTSSDTPTSTDTSGWQDGNKTRVFLMQPGDCFNYDSLSGTSSQYAWVVDCTTAHDAEVFAVGQVTDTTYPTDQGWVDWGSQICETNFTDYVGIPWYQSLLDVYHLFPDEQTWTNEPTIRQMTCVAVDPDGGLTNSIRGSKR